MSGHSKWSQIKHQKGAADLKRGKIFSKFARSISMAAKDGGDPNFNYKLRLIIDRAKASGMPNDNIDKAIKRGTGEEKGIVLSSAVYEGFGPALSAFIVETATDNTNRTLQEIKTAFIKNNGRLAETGSVLWMFEHVGLIKAQSKEVDEIELFAIDLGAKDVVLENDIINIYTDPKQLMEIKQKLEQKKIELLDAELLWQSKTPNIVTEGEVEKIEKLYNAIDDLDDVVNIYTNTI